MSPLSQSPPLVTSLWRLVRLPGSCVLMFWLVTYSSFLRPQLFLCSTHSGFLTVSCLYLEVMPVSTVGSTGAWRAPEHWAVLNCIPKIISSGSAPAVFTSVSVSTMYTTSTRLNRKSKCEYKANLSEILLALKLEPRSFKTKGAINFPKILQMELFAYEPIKQKRRLHQSNVVVHTCNHNIWAVKTKRLRRTWATLQDQKIKKKKKRGRQGMGGKKEKITIIILDSSLNQIILLYNHQDRE